MSCSSQEAIRFLTSRGVQISLNDEGLPYEVDMTGAENADDLAEAIGRLDGITDLVCWASDLTDKGLERLQGMATLTDIMLDGTKITPAGLAYLGGMTCLSSFSAASCALGDLGMQHISRWQHVRELSVSDNGVTDIGFDCLTVLPALDTLELLGNPVSGAGISQNSNVSTLRSLSLESTQCDDDGIAFMEGCKNLEHLSLSGTYVTDRGVIETIRQLQSLRFLGMSRCCITDAAVEAIAALPELRCLYLVDTPIGIASLEHLQRASTLESVDLSETRIPKRAIREFRKKRPDCEVDFSTIQG